MSNTISKIENTTLPKTNINNLSIDEGVVIAYNLHSGNYTLTSASHPRLDCIWVAGFLSSFLGVKVNGKLENGSKVLYIYDSSRNIGYIIGSVPTMPPNLSLQSANYIGSSGETLADTSETLSTDNKISNKNLNATNDGSMPMDLIEGELSLSNSKGPALNILSFLSSIQGSALAKVECHVMDDMVRILSNTYENISAFGDYKIYNEKGALNVEWHGTSYEHESFDLESNNKPKVENFENNNITNIEDEEKAFYGDSKWRFSTYIGKLGNFIHLFITDPNRMLEKSSTSTLPGRLKFHINEDGTILIQSVADIIFEKTPNIPVPQYNKRWEDCEDGDLDTKLDAYKNWVPLEGEDIWETSFKFRDYAKRIANVYCNAGFLNNKRFSQPLDSEIKDKLDPFAKNLNKEKVDSKFKEKFEEYNKTYATIRIDKAGTIIVSDAAGSSIHFCGNGDVNISAKNNLNFYAANGIHFMSKDLTSTTTGNIEINAIGGTSISSKKGIRTYASNGPILLETDFKKEDIDNESDLFITDAQTDKSNLFGVMIKTNNSSDVLVHSQNILTKANNYVNLSTNVLFKSANFLVDKVLKFTNGLSRFFNNVLIKNTLQAKDILINHRHPINGSSESGVGIFKDENGELGKTFDSKGILPETEIKDLKELTYKDLLNTSKFEYFNIEEETLHENITQQLISTDNTNDGKYESKSILELSVNPAKGYPYPTDKCKLKSYIPKIKNLGSKSEVNETKLEQAKFLNSKFTLVTKTNNTSTTSEDLENE